VSGSISPAHAKVEVKIVYTKPDGYIVTRKVLTDDTGRYSDRLQPDLIGTWSVQASWDGDSDHKAATSGKVYFSVVSIQRAFKILLAKNATELKFGDAVNYTITLLDDKGSELDPDSLNVYFDAQSVQAKKLALGKYCVVITGLRAGMHTLSVIASKNGAEQTAYDNFLVKKANAVITISANKETYEEGESIELNGKVEPAIKEASILVQITLPTKEVRVYYANADSEGHFTLTIPANLNGTWKFKARFLGDLNYEATESTELKVSVEKKTSEQGRSEETIPQDSRKEEQKTEERGLGLSEILNIVLAIVVIVFVIIFIKGWR